MLCWKVLARWNNKQPMWDLVYITANDHQPVEIRNNVSLCVDFNIYRYASEYVKEDDMPVLIKHGNVNNDLLEYNFDLY